MSVFPILECVSLVLSSFASSDKPQLAAPAKDWRCAFLLIPHLRWA